MLKQIVIKQQQQQNFTIQVKRLFIKFLVLAPFILKAKEGNCETLYLKLISNLLYAAYHTKNTNIINEIFIDNIIRKLLNWHVYDERKYMCIH